MYASLFPHLRLIVALLDRYSRHPIRGPLVALNETNTYVTYSPVGKRLRRCPGYQSVIRFNALVPAGSRDGFRIVTIQSPCWVPNRNPFWDPQGCKRTGFYAINVFSLRGTFPFLVLRESAGHRAHLLFPCRHFMHTRASTCDRPRKRQL